MRQHSEENSSSSSNNTNSKNSRSNTCTDHIIQTRLKPFCFILTGLLEVENERYEGWEREMQEEWMRKGRRGERGREKDDCDWKAVPSLVFVLKRLKTQDKAT